MSRVIILLRLNNLIILPYTYNTKNSYEIAQELNNIQISKNNRMIQQNKPHTFLK